MNFINFITANWDSILAAAVIIASIFFAVVKQEKAIIFKMLYALVTEAEKQYGGGTGELKLSSVVAQVYEKLPSISKFIPVKTLEKWVETALVEAREKWKKNANIATYIVPDSKE